LAARATRRVSIILTGTTLGPISRWGLAGPDTVVQPRR